ncbi:MAG: sensor histidine kinase [Burkholderiales bacterium PBB4]|nr:MAG: sensor histidine kinase [Burkholderiales bacterium PBB4]
MFQREQRSLFGEILDWMLTPLLLLWPVSLVLTWLVAQGIAGKPFDRALEYNVTALAQLITVHKGQVQFVLPLPARELLRADDTDDVYYQVRGSNGEFLSGEKDLPAPPAEENLPVGEVRLRDGQFKGTDLKIAYMWVRLEQPDAKSLVWLALVQAIKPLNHLEERIRARSPDDLSPLDVETVPLEVTPLVSSVNDLLMRLKDSIATQKRFLADAAHQLKTPLAGLRMQADLAQRQGASAEDLKQSLRQIGRSSIRATHTVNQLLALARAESSGTVISHQPCDLAQITMNVVRDCLPRAMDKHIDLGIEGAQPGSEGVRIEGNPTLLTEMIRNLIDNAINYTPSTQDKPGVITARVLVDPFSHVLVLQVEDTGTGIAPAERELVFQPFYRVLGTEADGSGLGLPIVREIARQHHATITIDDAHPGPNPVGTCFTVRFQGPSHAI